MFQVQVWARQGEVHPASVLRHAAEMLKPHERALRQPSPRRLKRPARESRRSPSDDRNSIPFVSKSDEDVKTPHRDAKRRRRAGTTSWPARSCSTRQNVFESSGIYWRCDCRGSYKRWHFRAVKEPRAVEMVTEKVVFYDTLKMSIPGFVAGQVSKGIKDIPVPNSKNVRHRSSQTISGQSSYSKSNDNSIDDNLTKKRRRKHPQTRNRRKAIGKSAADKDD